MDVGILEEIGKYNSGLAPMMEIQCSMATGQEGQEVKAQHINDSNTLKAVDETLLALRDPKRPKRPQGGLGKGKSTVTSKEKRAAFRNGTLEVDGTDLNTWKQTICADDPLASFNPVNLHTALP